MPLMAALRHRVHDCVKRGNIEDIKKLLKQNPELVNDKGEDEWTPLFRAAYNGRLALVKFLVEHGASLGRDADEWQNTPLHACSINGHRPVAEYLIAHGADVNEQENIGRWTPLYAASYFGHREMVQLLVQHGADPYLRDREGKTALDVVCEAGYRRELKPVILAMLQNLPPPTASPRVHHPNPPTRLTVSTLTMPTPTTTAATNPPNVSETRQGHRVYFPWELSNADYASRATEMLQEAFLTAFRPMVEASVIPPLPPPPVKYKPCMDTFDLLQLATDHKDELATFWYPRLTEETTKHDTEEGFSAALDMLLEQMGVALHRATFGREDVETLFAQVLSVSSFFQLEDLQQDVEALQVQFRSHCESKSIRLQFLRETHKADLYEEEVKVPARRFPCPPSPSVVLRELGR